MVALAERPVTPLEGRLPDGWPPFPEPSPYRRLRRWSVPWLLAATASLPLLMMGASLLVGGGPRAESADDALLTLAMNDAAHGHGLVGAYSRFGWHHPGPSYLYVAGVPTRLWGGGPTGSWIGAVGVGIVAVVALALLVRRWAGDRAGWWAASAVVAVIVGLGPGLFRDPWNPYAVTLPVLFTAAAACFAAAGTRGALGWAALGGSFAIQTHVSTAPLVVGLLAIAAGAHGLRRMRGAAPRLVGDIPDPLPPLAGGRSARWHPGQGVVAGALIALVWLPPLWDEAFGSHNLTAIWDFFTSPHPTHSWDQAWRLVAAMYGTVLYQHHAALHDGVPDVHPLLTTVGFVGLSLVAIVTGVRRQRPAATWLGVGGLFGGVLCIYSVTRVVGFPYRYLLVWMVAVPALPIIGAAIGLVGGRPRARPALRIQPAVALTTAAALIAVVAAIDGVMAAPPAAALTDRDIVHAWQLVQPAVGAGPGVVRLQLNDGDRWPSAAGLALELERRGHPVRVDPPWTLLFGTNRRSHGGEGHLIIIGSADPRTWPPNSVATPLGAAGKASYFVGTG